MRAHTHIDTHTHRYICVCVSYIERGGLYWHIERDYNSHFIEHTYKYIHLFFEVSTLSVTATAYHGKGTFENSKSNSAEAPSRSDNDVLMHPEQCELGIS